MPNDAARKVLALALKATDPLDYLQLRHQIDLQKRLAWDMMDDIPWDLGVDPGCHLLPLDDMAIAFPGASAEQRLALSQWMGLVVNATISEMEDTIPKLRYVGWERILRDYPSAPEMWELGDMFFEEECKHSRAFSRYLDEFCIAHDVERGELDPLFPKSFGSFFQRAIAANATAGGHAFWWIVAAVEEVSIGIYSDIYRSRKGVDPLYFQLHRRHLEEEARHANYAFLMLNLIERSASSWRRKLHLKTNYVLAQVVGAPWVLSELAKIYKVKDLKTKHPFFEVLSSCLPLLESMPKHELVHRMFVAAPYVSWLLNPKNRKHIEFARNQGAFIPPFPDPKTVKLAI